jgi:predicted transcriptional regulator
MPASIVRPIAVKLDPESHSRIKRLAEARNRSTHWMMREAIAQYIEREEKREAFRQDGIRAWQEYQSTGLHATQQEADAWLAKLEAGEDAVPPKCHV